MKGSENLYREEANEKAQIRYIEDLELLKNLELQVSILKEGNDDIDEDISEITKNIENIKSLNEEIIQKINDIIDHIELAQ